LEIERYLLYHVLVAVFVVGDEFIEEAFGDLIEHFVLDEGFECGEEQFVLVEVPEEVLDDAEYEDGVVGVDEKLDDKSHLFELFLE
jgi:uncharacterized protein YheU (UPF0270 family)